MIDDDLGELSEQGDELSCSFTHGDQVVTVTILLEGALPEEVIPLARELKRSFDTLIERAWQLLVDEVLPIINKGYRGEGELPVTNQEFRRLVRFEGARGSMMHECKKPTLGTPGVGFSSSLAWAGPALAASPQKVCTSP